MSSRSATVRVAAVVLGALAAVAVVMVTVSPDERRDEPVAAVRDDFVARWERWRKATVAFTEESTRRSEGRDLVTEVTVVQRFPDRIVTGGTDVSGTSGSRLVGCTVPAAGAAQCFDNGSYRPDEELRLELDDVRRLLGGPDPVYRISRTDDRCFRLRRLGIDPDARWGDRTDVCFDPRTGVAERESTTTGSGAAALTIDVRRTDVRIDVTDADLALPATPRLRGG